ncbi:MAG: polysaccharide biosynthesis C-terminal domain-containing protein [Elusimicrobia bacterium]|nr:polysaccharide biosynthesis C-terminal domain-containing protein [Elusimicrobiota bacterium]
MSIARRFARNTGINLAGQFGIAVIGFFVTPYLVRRLGIETYALYVLLYAAAGYLSLLSFGAGAATVKYTAQFHAARNRSGLRDILLYSGATHLLGALVGAAAVIGGARFWAVRLFHIPPGLVELAAWVLCAAAVGAVFAALIQFSSGVLQGLQRFDWQAGVALLQNGLMPLGAAVLVARGGGVRSVAAWYVLLQAGLCLLLLAVLWMLLRPARSFRDGERLPLKGYAAFSGSTWLVLVASVVNVQLDKTFITRTVSLADLTLYSVPAGLLQRIQTLPATIGAVLLPMMSGVQGPDARERLVRMYVKSSRLMLWVVLPLLVLLFSLMPQFLTLWLGPGFVGRSVWPARLLVIMQAFAAANFIPNSVSTSRDHPEYYSAAAWAQALLGVLAWLWLIPRYQILGAAMGALMSQVLVAAGNVWLVHRKLLALTWRDYFQDVVYRPALSAALLLAAVFPLHALAQTWSFLLLLGAGGGLAYAAMMWIGMHDEDREFIRALLA